MNITIINKVKELVKVALPFCLFTFLPSLISCDELSTPDIDDILSSDEQQMETAGDALQITDISFSKDYKVMELPARLMHDVGGHDLTDSTMVVASVHQHVKHLIGKLGEESQPVITKVSNNSRETFNKLNMKLLVLVDLSLPQDQIDAERKAVKEIKALFGSQSLYIAFMQGDNVSETYEATDYVIDNYFVHKEPSVVYLYRSVVTKLAEMQDVGTTMGSAHYKVMIILSGGKTYENELPVDPMHFELQQLLKDKATECKGLIEAYYAGFTSNAYSDGQEIMVFSDNVTDTNILQYFCTSLGGLYQSSFNWQEMESDILGDFNIDLSNYKVTIEQPDQKVFRGDLHVLEVAFHDKETGDMIAKGQTEFSLGSVYNPIIINDGSITDYVIDGIVLTLIIILIVWLVLQFLDPYIRYLYFKHKYVIKYVGSSMSFQGEPVQESCYLCKSPFKMGDEIVVKCKHTMHKECWDDNEYHCPEHGRHCSEGSHYYNPHNLLDSHNPMYFMKWVLVAILAGFTAWCVFVTNNHFVSASLVEYMHAMVHHASDTPTASYSLEFGSSLSDLPAYGLAVGFLLTFFLSNFTVRGHKWYMRLGKVLIRAIIAGVVGFLFCLLGCLISLIFHVNYSTILTDWIPWALLSGVIMLALTVKTRTPIRKSFIIAACVIAVLSMSMWFFIYYNPVMDYRLSLLIGFIVYAVAIALCVASVTPRSERYFLHVEGAIKEMDIALYKWFKASPGQSITIGKSVDCNIQLSWDINGHLAPVNAEIQHSRRDLRLLAREEGVIVNGQPLPVGKAIWLYHGRSFTIGNTTFTYIEKDL